MKKKSKHYDDKRDLIRQMKKDRNRADSAIYASFSVYMLMALLVLYEDLQFREKRIMKFVNGIYKRIDLYRAGKLSVDSMQKDLFEKAGVAVEPPRIEL